MDREILSNQPNARNTDLPAPQQAAAFTVCIGGLTQSVLQRYSDEIKNKNIKIETDLPQFSANVYQRLIDLAVCQLVENAIEKTPPGGEVNITLVESGSRWELEVADSAPQHLSANEFDSGRNQHVTRFNQIRNAVDLHGGTVRSFNCPQGGTANSILIPIHSNSPGTA